MLVLLSAVVLLPEILLRKWWVDDAAITFAYARNLVNGDGLVAFAGGERAEGYSDPLWMALLALGQLAHLDPFLLSKVLGGLLAAATVPLAWLIARWMPLPDRVARSARYFWMLVAALVATNAQHGIWACAGLENSLMSFLLAVGVWRVLVESEDGGFPWSALVFVGVALTHSEGVIYGAFAFLLVAWSDWRHGRRRRILAWVAMFGSVLVVYQAARYAYFALPYPLPYYAKLQQTRFSAINWNSRCWTYLRHWGTRLGWGYLVPVIFVGVGGLRGWRLKTLLGLFLAGVAVLLLPGGAKFNLARVGVFSVIGFALPLLALRPGGSPGEGKLPIRLLCTGFTMLAIAFSVKTNGDWMSGFRRFSSLVLPLMVIYVMGLAIISSKLPCRWARVGLPVLLGGGAMVWNLFFIVGYARHPTGMTPMTTRTRVREFNKMARTLHLDRQWVAVDHAMGGQMWFAPPNGRVIDWYGLTDVASALARSTHGFDEDYLLKPPVFDLAHIEKGLRKSKLYNSLYIEVPRARGRNKDNWVARSLLSAPAWPDDGSGLDRSVRFDGGHQLVGFRVRSPEVYPAGGAYLELGLSRSKKVKRNFLVEVKLSGPVTATIKLSPGYKRLYPPARWPPGQVFIGRYDLALPEDLPIGTYDMGFSLVDKGGRVEEPVTGSGEVTFPSILRVVSEQDAREQARADWQRAVEAARGLDCEAADRAWKDALEHLPLDDDWERTLHERAEGPLSGCWAALADKASDLRVAVEDLRRARRWDVRSAAAAAVGAKVADAHWDEAMAARATGDQRRSLELFEAIVHADPTRSWARRYAEDARATILDRKHSH